MAEPGPEGQDIPAPNSPPAPAQAGQQAQQQQQQEQDHLAPLAHAPAGQQPGQQVVHLNWSHVKEQNVSCTLYGQLFFTLVGRQLRFSLCSSVVTTRS